MTDSADNFSLKHSQTPQINLSSIRPSGHLICMFQILLQSLLLSTLFLYTSIIFRMLTAEYQAHAHGINYTHPSQSRRINTQNVKGSSLCLPNAVHPYFCTPCSCHEV